MSEPEPCESCGAPVLFVHTAWHELWFVDGRTQRMPQHTPERCQMFCGGSDQREGSGAR